MTHPERVWVVLSGAGDVIDVAETPARAAAFASNHDQANVGVPSVVEYVYHETTDPLRAALDEVRGCEAGAVEGILATLIVAERDAMFAQLPATARALRAVAALVRAAVATKEVGR